MLNGSPSNRRGTMPSKRSAKTTVLVLLTLGTLVHTLCGDLHSPEDPVEFTRVTAAYRLTKTAALMIRTLVFVVDVLRKTAAHIKFFCTGAKAWQTTNCKCLCVPRELHL